MSKEKSGVKNVRIIVYGYGIMILVLFLLQVSRLLVTNAKVEIAAIAGTMLGWLVLLAGFHLMSSRGAQFKRGRAACAFGILMVAGQAFYVAKDLKAGLGDSTFIDIFVLFFWFMSICALLYTFAKALKGMQPIVELTDEGLAAKYPRTAILVGTVVVLVLVFMPVMQMLPKVTGYVGTLLLGLAAALAQGYICKLLLDGYHAVRADREEALEAAEDEEE